MFGNNGRICIACVGRFMSLVKLYDQEAFEGYVERARALEPPPQAET